MEDTECLCDECGQDFALYQVRECPLNGDDNISKVCMECCKRCGYYVEYECGF